MKNIPLYITNTLSLVALFVLTVGLHLGLQTLQPGLPERLIVLTPHHEAGTGQLAPFGVGYERELVENWSQQLAEDVPELADLPIEWRSVDSRDAALELLRTGQAHIAVGFGGETDNLGVEQGVGLGPIYYHAHTLSVPLPSLDKPLGGTDADAALHFLDARSWSVWEPFVGALADSDVRSEVNSAVNSAAEGGAQEPYRWFWSSQHPVVNRQLNKFWASLNQPDNTLLEQLEERYYGYLPDSVNPYSVQDFLSIVNSRLPRYSRVIAQAADKADIDPLLFTAVIIQESRMYEGTVSHTGVQGIMQLTKETARYLKVDRLDPVQALRGGARYLRMLWKDLEDQGIEEWDRWFFTLAAFNQGPRRLEGARQLSRKLGGSGNTWRELKEVYPLLTQAKYAAMVGQTTFRGKEAVQFVERVRWYYHILRGLVTLDRPEAQNLAPLLGRSVTRAALGF